MSPGRVASPSGMFSAAATTATRWIGSPSSQTVFIAPNTLAAPPMSYFISSMLAPGFREIPPVSKVMPLPTRDTGLPVAPL